MSRISLATPCPVPHSGFSFALQDDATCTGDIDYTRAIAREFSNARPRRKSTFPSKADRRAAVTVFEDVVEDEVLVVNQPVALVGKTLLSKPARKRPVAHGSKQDIKHDQYALGESMRAEQHPPSVLEVGKEEDEWMNLEVPKHATAQLRKDPRRRTIFVPADDTSILTIHPGANTTNRLDDTFHPPNQAVQPPPSTRAPSKKSTPVQEPVVPQSRMSLAVAPKRIPLQHLEAKQNVPAVDVPGQNGGKENVPPGHLTGVAKDYKMSTIEAPVVPNRIHQSRSKAREAAAASHARRVVAMRTATPPTHPQTTSNLSTRIQTKLDDQPPQLIPGVKVVSRTAKSVPNLSSKAEEAIPPPRQADGVTERRSGDQRPSFRRELKARLAKYPVLCEDVSQAQLYNESWMSHQEIAMTELINGIFDSARPKQEAWCLPQKSLREQLLDLYHQPSVATLHARLEASLLYGALSRPKDLPHPPDPTMDVGLRKRYLTLWLDNYDEQALRAAAEVVVGRQVPDPACSLPQATLSSHGWVDPCSSRKVLAGFLDTFFVNVEDMQNTDADAAGADDMDRRRWRRTILRSLMLIWLLDHAKSCGSVVQCLFKRTSIPKSSTAVLHALTSMLIPSIGEITRVLRHTNYEAAHVQSPVDEVHYHIGNIAIDLRDGVMLTRLVEILLFTRRRDEQSAERELTIAIQMPDATVVESTLYTENGTSCPRVLSQHLKLPCVARAQKVYNVQMVLGAMQAHDGAADGSPDLATADDIVDGHREKSLSFLWSLVRRHGLAQLMDWAELQGDIQRATGERPRTSEMTSEVAQEDLLQAWAVAHCNRQGVQITNLTTCFANETAYAAILDAFSHFLPGQYGLASTSSTVLETRLRSLGCSTSFIKQLTNAGARIPTQSTTISNLAFLASRLLPLARRHFAASVIQRAFKIRANRATVTRRIALMRLVHACAAVVQMRKRLIDAATTLQRAWRRVLDCRIANLSRDVEAFQMCARGWIVRNRAGKSAMSGDLKHTRSLRVMGGW